MKPIIIHDQAKQGLGLDFLAEVETALEKIKLNPSIGLSYTVAGEGGVPYITKGNAECNLKITVVCSFPDPNT